MERKQHWEKVYASRAPDAVSWYQRVPRKSLDLIRSCVPRGSVIDVGGGASLLVDRLVELGFEVAVLDLSAKALFFAKDRLGAAAAKVQWIEGDVTAAQLPPEAFDVWHDRAVFHFLTDPADRALYKDQLRCALKPGGWLVMATFSLAGPPKCSGLDVARYSSETLSKELGKDFELLEAKSETHVTPFDTRQEFVFCRFKRR